MLCKGSEIPFVPRDLGLPKVIGQDPVPRVLFSLPVFVKRKEAYKRYQQVCRNDDVYSTAK